MRLLFITRKFPPSVGGMEIYSHELYRAMRDAGVEVDLHIPRRPMLGRPSLLQISVFFLGACTRLVGHRHRYDALLIGDFAIASLACIARLGPGRSPRIGVALHGQDLYFMRRRSLVATLYRAIARMVLCSRAIDVALANSDAIRREAHARGFAKVTVVPLATILPELRGVPRARPHRLVFAGRLIRYKGLSWFVENVWPRLDRNLELHVAGEVWDEAELTCLRNDPRIRYLGKVDYEELPALRESAIACIMPNRPPAEGEQDEGFGLSALESAAVGTPIVAARTGGLPDAVIDGVTGYLVEPLDVDAWVEKINAIANWDAAERERFAVVARKAVDTHYRWSRVAADTLVELGWPRTPPSAGETAS
jgi:phosphatidylinositol alpha-1,6-mannosyltransferase